MDGQGTAPALYRHTQVGYLMVVGLGLAAVAQAASLARAVRERKRGAWALLPAIELTAGLAYVMSGLTVEVTRDHVRVSFRRGLLRRTIDMARVRGVRQVKVPWYWGWGARLTPQGWLYSVQGRHAVRLDLQKGWSVLVGTDQPAELMAAIEAVRRGR